MQETGLCGFPYSTNPKHEVPTENIHHDAVLALARALTLSTSLTSLDLSWNNMRLPLLHNSSTKAIVRVSIPKALIALVDAISVCTTLRTLDFSGNNILTSVGTAATRTQQLGFYTKQPDSGMQAIAAALRGFPSPLQHVDLSANDIVGDFVHKNKGNVRLLAESVGANESLISLKITKFKLPIWALKYDAVLDLSNHDLVEAEFLLIAVCLACNHSLKSLHAVGNHAAGRHKFSDEESTEGLEALCAAIEAVGGIEELDLSQNWLGPRSAEIMASMVGRTPTLASLNLAGNLLAALDQTKFQTLSGGEALRRREHPWAAENRRVLSASARDQGPHLASVTPDDAGLTAISAMLERGKALTSLDLSNNCLGPQGALALALGIRQASTLESLNIAKNHLCGASGTEPGGIQAIVEALEENFSLRNVVFSDNHLDSKSKAALRTALRSKSNSNSNSSGRRAGF